MIFKELIYNFFFLQIPFEFKWKKSASEPIECVAFF